MKHLFGGTLILAVMLSLSACGDDPVPGVVCETGERCACQVSADCPTGESCDLFDQVCVGGDTDADVDVDSDAGDAGTDTTDVTVTPDSDAGEPDTDVLDPDTADGDEEDTDADALEPDADVVDDADAQDSDTEVDADDATDGSAEVDGGPGPSEIDPWLVWEEDFLDRPTLAFGRLTSDEYIAMPLPVDGEGVPTTRNEQPSWSFNGQEVVTRTFIRGEGFRIRVINITNGTQEVFNPNSGDVLNLSNPSLSPDGTTVAFTGRGRDESSDVRRLFVMPRATQVATPVSDVEIVATGATYLADGQIVFRCDDDVCVVDPADPDGSLDTLTGRSNIVGAPSATPDGTRLTWVDSSGAGDTRVVIYDLATDESIAEVAVPIASDPAFSANGFYVAFGQDNPDLPDNGQDLGFLDAFNGIYLGVLRGTELREAYVRFSPVDASGITIVLPSAE